MLLTARDTLILDNVSPYYKNKKAVTLNNKWFPKAPYVRFPVKWAKGRESFVRIFFLESLRFQT